MKKILLVIAVMMGVMVHFGSMPVVMAAEAQDSEIYGDVCSDSSIDKELKKQAGCGDKREFSSVTKNIINTAIGLIGLVAVGVMILGGIKYVTSTGDPGKIKQAKDIIIYGLIGLVVVILAWTIVAFITSNVPTA